MVQRYNPSPYEPMDACESGDYVLSDDYDVIAARLRETEEQIEAMRGEELTQVREANISLTETCADRSNEILELRAELARAREALQMASRWLGTGHISETYDDIAAWYHDETGRHRPGKDVPACSGTGMTHSALAVAFEEWAEKKGTTVRAAIRTALLPTAEPEPCPACNGQGWWHAHHDPTREPEQEQCETCRGSGFAAEPKGGEG
jgi:hypothetical protein